MGRISAGLTSIELRLLDRLARANASSAAASLRLASGHKILSPADNPTAFFSKTLWQAEQAGLTATLGNVQAASTIVSGAQLALDQIRTQLETIREKASADRDGSLDADERAANQADIDAAIHRVAQLANTSISGRRVLDGSADFSYRGVNTAQVAAISVLSLGPYASKTLAGSVVTPGTRAELVHTEGTGSLIDDATIMLSGPRGAATIELEEGQTLAEAAEKFNAQSDLTGVTATVDGNNLRIRSIDYGSRMSITLTVDDGTFAVTGGNGDGTAGGVDLVATINGRSVTGVGNTVALYDGGFQASLTFQGGFSGTFDTMLVAGHGLNFALSPDLNAISTLAIPGVQPARLGGLSGKLSDLLSGGSLSGLDGNAPQAVRVVDEALAQLTVLEGRVDGFATAAIGSSAALLEGTATAVQAALDSVDKVNPAEETAIIQQDTLLADSALAGLAILNQQRQSLLDLIWQIARNY